MAVTVKNIIPPKQAEAVATAQYQASNCKCIIDKFTVTNTAAANVSISVNLITPSGSVAASNRILSSKVVVPNETYTCPELVGQVLESGGIISTTASAATSLTIMASGREVT
jgi:hypothetical protein